MRPNFLTVALALVATIAASNAAAQSSGEQVRVTVSAANIRAGAGTDHRVITTARQGTVFPVLGKEGAWFRIRLVVNDRVLEGFVHSSTVKVETVAAPTPERAPVEEAREAPPPVPAPARHSEASRRTASPLTLRLHGVKLGLSLSSFEFQKYPTIDADYDSHLGLAFGVAMVVPVSEMFWLQPEVILMQKGMSERSEETVVFVTVISQQTIALTYLELPVLGRLNLSTEGGTDPYLLFGPVVALKLQSRRNYTYTMNGETSSYSGSVENVNSSDIGVLLGAGAERGRWFGEARYNLGLLNITNEGKAKNRNFAVLAGYRLGLTTAPLPGRASRAP
jgi:hypothetical protein